MRVYIKEQVINFKNQKENLIMLVFGLQTFNAYLSTILDSFGQINIFAPTLLAFSYFFALCGFFLTIRKKRSFIAAFVLYSIMIFSFLFHESTLGVAFNMKSLKDAFLSDGIMLIGLHIPIFLMCLSGFNEKNLIEIMIKYGKVLISLFILAFSLKAFIFHQTFDYMNITYGILPYVMICFGYGLTRRDFLSILLSVISIGLILVGGSRGAAFTCIVYFALLYIARKHKKLTIKSFLIFFLSIGTIFVLILNINLVIIWLSSTLEKFGFSSRTLNLYLGVGYEQGLLRYSDRSELQLPLIKQINFFGHGLFGDRLFLSGAYAHNILLEVLINFGYIVGTLICILFITYVIKSFKVAFKTSSDSIAILLLTGISLICVKYMFSSSYLHATEFWLFSGLMIWSSYIKGQKSSFMKDLFYFKDRR